MSKSSNIEGCLIAQEKAGTLIDILANIIIALDQKGNIILLNKTEQQIEELEKFNKILIDRELKMINLKKKLETLERKTKK